MTTAPTTSSAPKRGATGTTNVTYVPQRGDPASTIFHGHTFQANVPLPVDGGKHPRLLAQAKTNPWFRVEGEAPVAPPERRPPETPEEYRQWAVGWLNELAGHPRVPGDPKASVLIKQRWEVEEPLRHQVGVGSDDLEFLNNLFQPRLAELERMEAD